jgi:hypothetical protein
VKKIILLLVFLLLWIWIDKTAIAEVHEPAITIPPIVAQTYGPGNTIIMWHDTNDDGIPEYKATYIFKGGRLHIIKYIFKKDFKWKQSNEVYINP